MHIDLIDIYGELCKKKNRKTKKTSVSIGWNLPMVWALWDQRRVGIAAKQMKAMLMLDEWCVGVYVCGTTQGTCEQGDKVHKRIQSTMQPDANRCLYIYHPPESVVC